ncbi:CopG family ribbon-helix-helix protein [Terasakiella sp.]|uniref:CopG family ribbon-helix-helix protein n=1 Tax=Terasakiella sp. TaxID=2034861 RepID=UPI003AFFA0AB
MERITITIDDDLLADFDRLIEMKGYSNRSEGIRDAIRQLVKDQQIAENDEAPASDASFICTIIKNAPFPPVSWKHNITTMIYQQPPCIYM